MYFYNLIQGFKITVRPPGVARKKISDEKIHLLIFFYIQSAMDDIKSC